MLEALTGTVTRITVPFDGAPGFYSTNRYGAPVVRGDSFTVRYDDGSLQEF